VVNQFLVSSVLASLYAVTKVLRQIWGPFLPASPPAGGYGEPLLRLWQYLNLIRNSFYILFPAKSIVSCRQIISGRLSKELLHSLTEHFKLQ